MVSQLKAYLLLHASLLVSSATAAGTFFSNHRVVSNHRPNTQTHVLQDVPGEDRTMDSYNEAVNRALRASQSQQQKDPTATLTTSRQGGDSSMSQYIMAMNKQQQQSQNAANSNNIINEGSTTTKKQDDSAMAAYVEALAERQRESQQQVRSSSTASSDGARHVNAEAMRSRYAEQKEEALVGTDERASSATANRPRDQSEMFAYMEAMAAVQRHGETPVDSERQYRYSSYGNESEEDPSFDHRSLEEFVPDVEDLSAQHERLQEKQGSLVAPVGLQFDKMDAMTMQHDVHSMQPQTSLEQQQFFQHAAQRKHQQFSVSEEMQMFQPDPERQYNDLANAQEEHVFQSHPEQKNQAFQPESKPLQAMQPDPETAAVRYAEKRVEKSPDHQTPHHHGQSQPQYQKKPQEGSIFAKDYKYKTSVPRIAEMYTMASDLDGHTHQGATGAKAFQPDPEPAPVRKLEKKVEQQHIHPSAKQPPLQQQQQQQQQPQYYKKPQEGSIFAKDYKYKAAVPRIADMYNMGPPPENAETVFPVVGGPEFKAPKVENKSPHITLETSTFKGKEPKNKNEVEDMMASQMEAGMRASQMQPPLVPGKTESSFQVDIEPAQEEPPPSSRSKVFIPSFPIFGAFDATTDSDYDAYGNLKRKPTPQRQSSHRPQPQQGAKQGPPPPDLIIPAVSQLPDWAQNPFPSMGSSAPTDSLKFSKPSPVVSYAPAPTSLIIPAVSQLPHWAQNPYPEMGNPTPTASLKSSSPPRSASYAPAPPDLVIPAVSQVPDWARNPSPMGGSNPSPAPRDLMIPAVTYQQLPAWAQNPFPQMGSSAPTESLAKMGKSSVSSAPPVPASNGNLISCSIEAYSDLPGWVLESQQKGSKAEVIDETFAALGGIKNDYAAVIAARESFAVSSSAAATTEHEIITNEIQKDFTSLEDNAEILGGKQLAENMVVAPSVSSPSADKDYPSSVDSKVKLEARNDRPKKDRLRERSVDKASVEQGDAFAAYMDVMAPIKTKTVEKRSKHTPKYEDPMDVFNEIMGPQQDFNIRSFGADSVDSVEELSRTKARNIKPAQKAPSLAKKSLDQVAKTKRNDHLNQDYSKKSGVKEGVATSVEHIEDKAAPLKDASCTKQDGVESNKDVTSTAVQQESDDSFSSVGSVTASAIPHTIVGAPQTHSSEGQDRTGEESGDVTKKMPSSDLSQSPAKKPSPSAQLPIPGTGDMLIRASASDVLNASPESIVRSSEDSVGLVDEGLIGGIDEAGRDGKVKGRTNTDEADKCIAPKQLPSDEALMAEVEAAMANYEEAMVVADKGSDLKEAVQHVLDPEDGPLSAWKNRSTKSRLFGGKDDAIRAHNHMKEMQREQTRKEILKAYQKSTSSDGSNPYFMNLNEPTMLMMDLQYSDQLGGGTGPAVMVSRDSELVAAILKGKPDLTTNILDSTSGLLIVNDSKLRDDSVPSLAGKHLVTGQELNDPCDATEQILRRTEVSEGYSAWDAFLKLESEWNELESSLTSRYDTRWLRKVQNGVSPPYQFVTEDATWSQPHCWEKLRAQKNKQLDYDVIVAGGSIGIFFAMALQLKGMNVCVVEGADLIVDHDDWGVSMEELLELKSLGIITQDDIEAAVEISLNSNTAKAQDTEAQDVFVSPSILISRVAERFKSGGGRVLEQSPMFGIAISEYTGSAVNLGEDKEPITASLVLDCIGENSPIARQRRYGRVPDGVCAVVGSCASGFKKGDVETGEGDMVVGSKIAEGSRERKKQFFWESVPQDKKGLFDELEEDSDPDAKTTYMFTYVDGDEERPSFKSLMDVYWRRLVASQNSSQQPTELDMKRVMFAYFPTYSDSASEPRWSRILDLGGLHDSLCVGGLSPLIPHLGRISNAILEALHTECLHKDDLAEINALIPSLSATWMLQKTMAEHTDEVTQVVANQLLSAKTETANELGSLPINPFFQDAVSFNSILGVMSKSSTDNPSLLPETMKHVGLPKVLDWMKHGSMMSVYDKFDKSVTPKLEERVAKLEPRQKFRWRRRLEAWKIGSGRGHINDGH